MSAENEQAKASHREAALRWYYRNKDKARATAKRVYRRTRNVQIARAAEWQQANPSQHRLNARQHARDRKHREIVPRSHFGHLAGEGLSFMNLHEIEEPTFVFEYRGKRSFEKLTTTAKAMQAVATQ